MTNVQDMIASWLQTYGSAEADAAFLLCDSHPEAAPAFAFVDASLDCQVMPYGELADRSKRLAAVLADRGVGPRDRVPVMMGKRPELVVTLIALWRLGAVHVLVHERYPSGCVAMHGDYRPWDGSCAYRDRSRAR